VRINRKLYVVPLEILNIFANQLLASYSSIQHSLRKRVISSFDVVIHHVSEKSTSDSHWHVQLRQFLVSIFLCSQIAKIQHL
jgi:hypothetical protein